jgi:hypothetical protein
MKPSMVSTVAYTFQPPLEQHETSRMWPHFFYHCHIGSFAIYAEKGRALFTCQQPTPVAVDAHLIQHAITPTHFWYQSEDRYWLIALSRYPNCGGHCDCGPCIPGGYVVKVYRYYDHLKKFHRVQICCANRYAIWGLRQASAAAGPSAGQVEVLPPHSGP